MARVIMLTHSEFQHRKSGVRFEATKVTRDGHRVVLGVADMPDDVAREHFSSNPDVFEVSGLEGSTPDDPTSDPLSPASSPAGSPTASASAVPANAPAPDATKPSGRGAASSKAK